MEADMAERGLRSMAVLKAVAAIPTPTLARMLAFRDRPECAAEVAFAVAALRARGVEVAEPEPPTQPSSELAALQNVRATPTPETHGNALAPVMCAHCEKNPATCHGVYEDPDGPDLPACDECCAHGNEDGWCEPLVERTFAPGPGDGAPRCSVCGNLCIDIAKDEHGACPNCSTIEWEERPDLNGSDDFEVEPR